MATNLNTMKETTGDCECCDKRAVIVTKMHGNMLMCVSCIELEKQSTARAVEANSMIQEARAIDASIQIKMDVFQAATVSAQQVKAAIDADSAIPADQKDYVMAQESLRRLRHLQQVILDSRNEARAWQVQVQEFSGKLRAEYREQFKNLDLNYQPIQPKSVKSGKTSSTKKFNKAELADAAKKYSVPAAAVQMIAVQRNMSADEAARTLAESMKKKA